MNIDELRNRIESEITSLKTFEDVKKVKASLLGRKGLFSEYLDGLKLLDRDEKKIFGKEINLLKMHAESRLKELESFYLEEEKRKKEALDKIDITMPGKIPLLGKKHPITQTLEEIIRIFTSLGFSVAEGPDIEQEYYNFEALNIPKDHPARDMQDTFYIKSDIVLRTHTSPVQIRTMESQLPPVKIIAPGSVYRCDNDISHTPMFHQVEGLMVDKRVRFSDLKGILSIFIREIFGENTPLRFRPSYFPFTEPSAEVDIGCVICEGDGCRVCKETGWLEILGSGMVHPQVLRIVGYDPEEVSGFAFGMGVERIAMLKFGIDDIRQFYYNDIRFLSQF
ncbi:MAG TPA: phenylalanine--tRNA ligase subunit alpha [Syntrophorhabdus sp.]|nr:phenylalanine--tRNA ligase subunit alpha [Syntrophorhabdus sp.]OPX94366.1 MAG: Phenylalanine--tRNA ligase alpha subunit [Syntrophorhabdus sp. PtaB.Bin027]OQB78063.1 MAG: Phenylalanine--tRNA ligase alpha subunit [Deltaproteobacteria bacterium ADurb.Bin135]NMC95766.1 phenylalanine--tRNA ligase subunit alpha [Syntrophorhabdus sp.]HNS77318.1 phenylalanine--tRNA ligase subunit alpha [Syntrophorhabdus sp.]